MVHLTPRQSTLIFGWLDPRPTLSWDDVLRLKLSLDTLITYRLRAADLATVQPDPAQWVQHAHAGLKHARFLLPLGANPFVHFGADLADVIGMRLTLAEMLQMGVTFQQLRRYGLTDRTEEMFRLDDIEWEMLGKPRG